MSKFSLADAFGLRGEGLWRKSSRSPQEESMLAEPFGRSSFCGRLANFPYGEKLLFLTERAGFELWWKRA